MLYLSPLQTALVEDAMTGEVRKVNGEVEMVLGANESVLLVELK